MIDREPLEGAPTAALTSPVIGSLDTAPLSMPTLDAQGLAFSVRDGQAQPSATGIWGMSAKGDGVVGSTGTSTKNGIVGRNNNKEAAPADQPVGNGVFGFSRVPNASGVFGSGPLI